MKVGTLVKYKNLSTPSLPCGHHIGHKYGMIGVVTGEDLSSRGETFYRVHWIDHPPHLEQITYLKVRLEVLCK